MADVNPCRPPASRVEDVTPSASDGRNFIAAGRAVVAGQGWAWIASGWILFRRQGGTWILLVLLAGASRRETGTSRTSTMCSMPRCCSLT